MAHAASEDAPAATERLHGALLAAWNAGDAAAFRALFSPDGTSIGFDGSQATGDEIETHLRGVFDDHETGEYVASVVAVSALGDRVGVLRARVGMVPPGRDAVHPDVNAVQTVVAERGDEGWRVVLFQNTPAQYHGRADLAEEHTREIERVRSAGRSGSARPAS